MGVRLQHAEAVPCSGRPGRQRSFPALARAGVLATQAVGALLDEARLTPKPALVDRRGSGAHRDLTLALLERSAHTLEPFFGAMAQAGADIPVGLDLRETLGSLGRQAEMAMLETTGGINTHRGAIWALGLLVAAAASRPRSAEHLCLRAGAIARLPDRFAGESKTHGSTVCSTYGTQGARGEAKEGFPHIRAVGLPALRRHRSSGCAEQIAQADTLLAIMTSLPDTCLLHRGGSEAFAVAQVGAFQVLALGGIASAAGQQAFHELEASLLHRWASPGGSADMLAGTLFVDRHFREAKHA